MSVENRIANILTPYNYTDCNDTGRIKYIVLHYTANPDSSAYANAKYYASTYVGASAHYFVDWTETIYRGVADDDIAWHVGASHYKHPYCRNSNSIGIEMCCHKTNKSHIDAYDTDWYLDDMTIANAVELTRYLMAKYNVPKENVIRHFDVTGKYCPTMWVQDPSRWEAFKARLVDYPVETKNDTSKAEKLQNEASTASQGISVKYQVFTNTWYPNVLNLEDYAGVENRAITAIYANTVGEASKVGRLHYRVHLLGNPKTDWLPWVIDREDYAGIKGRQIDCVQFWLEGVAGREAKYRVSPIGKTTYYPWVTGLSDYAGVYGIPIDKLQIEIV